MPRGIYAPLPNRRQLRHWEQVCIYLDAQPMRAVRFPYPLDPPISTKLLKRMAAYKLVRHCEDCSWRLSRLWPSILKRLYNRLPAQRETTTTPAGEADLHRRYRR